MKKESVKCSCAKKTSIGGQALMEGIMMRGPKTTAMAVRNTKGEIVVEKFETKGVNRPAICRWPIIRGVFGYIDSMTLGYRCLMRSAELSGLEDLVEESPKKKKKREAEEAKRAAEAPVTEEAAVTEEVAVTEEAAVTDGEEKKDEEKKDEEKLPAWVMTVTFVLTFIVAIGLAIGLFFFLPSFLYECLAKAVPVIRGENLIVNSLIKSAFEGVLKIALIVAYMASMALMKDIRRTFMFHGAEHKTIFCYEHGLELTVENIRRERRFHPRCGTSFLIIMVLVGILIGFFIPADINKWLLTALKIAIMPVVMGIGYELIKICGKHDNWLTRVISAPGLWFQRITVLEPDDAMIECAIAAMKEAIPDDNSDTI